MKLYKSLESLIKDYQQWHELGQEKIEEFADPSLKAGQFVSNELYKYGDTPFTKERCFGKERKTNQACGLIKENKKRCG